jgi:transcriptional antiterminator RfaH
MAATDTLTPRTDAPEFAWYCVRSQPKREHIAAAHLRSALAAGEGVEVYCPRLRFEKMTRRGRVWFTEALFPGYLFARFNLTAHQKIVTYAQGVTGIVRFGLKPTVVPDQAIQELREQVGDGEHEIRTPDVEEGDSVVVTSGVFKGLHTLVTRVIPSGERVRVLLEFLGECREVEVAKSELLPQEPHILTAA